jgi:hypothetical protein
LGHNIGHVHLEWALSEAAVLFLVDNSPGQQYDGRLENKDGPGKALTVLAYTLAQAVYDLFKRQTTFGMDRVLQGEGSGVGEPASLAGYRRNGRLSDGEPGFQEPWALCGRSGRLLGIPRATISHACAAPPLSLTLTGERPTFSLGVA